MSKGLNWELIPVAGKLLETVDLCWLEVARMFLVNDPSWRGLDQSIRANLNDKVRAKFFLGLLGTVISKKLLCNNFQFSLLLFKSFLPTQPNSPIHAMLQIFSSLFRAYPA